MASLSTNIRTQAPQSLVLIGEQILGLLSHIAEKSPKYQAITRYNALSDEELARQGMTRADVVHKVYGVYSCM